VKRLRGISEEAVLGKAYDARLVHWLWQWVRPHRLLVALSLGLFVCVAASQLVQPYLIKVAIDSYMIPGREEGLNGVALLFLLALTAEFVFRFLEIYVMQNTGQAVVYDLRTAANPVGRLVTRVTTDIESLNEVFASGVVTVVGDLVKLAGIIAIMVWLDARLALVTFAVIPLMVGLSVFFRIRLRNVYRNVRLRLARINSALNESLTGMKLVQLFGRQKSNYREFEQLNRAHREADSGSVVYDSLFSAVVEWVGSFSVALIIWYGGGRLVSGALTFGVLVAFIEYTQKFFVPIRELSTKYTVMQAAMASSERLVALLQEEPEPGALAVETAAPGPPSRRGLVEFQQVRFHYHEDEEILRDVSFCLRPGEKLAIVGITGSGKSTLIRLMVRLYEPTSGRILLDGTDIRALEPQVLRRRLGVVLQESFLFRGTIASNIALDEPAISRERIEAAARAVQADGFIRRLAGGYDHDVRQRGSNFSAGQRQLLAFARALAFDPEVLILDEATSSVDPVTESRLQQAVSLVTRERSSLIIAHRLSTVVGADRILVLHRGSVREEGTHRDLLRQDGLYARLYRLQTQTESGQLPGAAS